MVDVCRKYLESLLASETPITGCGIDCKFYLLPNGYGAKCYCNMRTWKATIAMQRRLACAGIAPQVLGDFEISSAGFVYITEVASMLCSGCSYAHSYNYWHELDCSEQLDLQIEMDRLHKELRLIGLSWCDDHLANVGRNDKGQLIIIDCGAGYFGSVGQHTHIQLADRYPSRLGMRQRKCQWS